MPLPSLVLLVDCTSSSAACVLAMHHALAARLWPNLCRQEFKKETKPFQLAPMQTTESAPFDAPRLRLPIRHNGSSGSVGTSNATASAGSPCASRIDGELTIGPFRLHLMLLLPLQQPKGEGMK